MIFSVCLFVICHLFIVVYLHTDTELHLLGLEVKWFYYTCKKSLFFKRNQKHAESLEPLSFNYSKT